MRNQKRTLIILLAILAILIFLILFVIPDLGKVEPSAAEDSRTFLCSLTRSDIQRIKYTTQEGTYALTLSDGVWTQENGAEADTNTVSNMLSAITGLYSTQLAYEGSSHLSDCGFDAPVLCVTASGPSGEITITIGSYNNGLDRWYCTVDSSTKIYLIGNNLPTRFGILAN